MLIHESEEQGFLHGLPVKTSQRNKKDNGPVLLLQTFTVAVGEPLHALFWAVAARGYGRLCSLPVGRAGL